MKTLLFILLLFPFISGFTPVKGPTDLGNEAYNKGNYDEALRQYQDAEKGRPESPEAHYNLGNAYYKKGEFDKALDEYKKAAQLDPKMGDAYYNAGDSFFRMKNYDDALKSYDKAKGIYDKADPDTEHNIEITKKLLEKQKQEQQKQQEQQKKKGGKGKQQNQKNQPGQSQAGQARPQGQGHPTAPRMSNEELQALLEKQARNEKRLRNYFRPGRKPDGTDRESQIEQMLRGMGFGPMERMPRPGEPDVERDW
jgi:Ca-activated chloride channel homolog